MSVRSDHPISKSSASLLFRWHNTLSRFGAGLVLRFYVTITLSIIAFVNAPNYSVVGIIVIVSLAIDVVRRAFSPERSLLNRNLFRGNYRSIPDAGHSIKTRPYLERTSVAIIAIWWILPIFLLLIGPYIIGSSVYFLSAVASSIYNMLSGISYAMRNIPIDLTNHGLSKKAMMFQLFSVVNIALGAVYASVFFCGYANAWAKYFARRFLNGIVPAHKFKNFKLFLLPCYLFGIFDMIHETRIIRVYWSGTWHPYTLRLSDGNSPLITYSLLIMGGFPVLMYTYSGWLSAEMLDQNSRCP